MTSSTGICIKKPGPEGRMMSFNDNDMASNKGEIFLRLNVLSYFQARTKVLSYCLIRSSAGK